MSTQLGEQYQSEATLTITLASLASSTTTARQSTAITNTNAVATGIGCEDVAILVKFKTGTGTSATGIVSVFIAYSLDGGTTYTGGATGSDGSYTINGNEIPLGIMQANADSTTYYGTFSIRSALGFVPQNWSVIVLNTSGGTADSTAGNHSVQYQGINTITS